MIHLALDTQQHILLSNVQQTHCTILTVLDIDKRIQTNSAQLILYTAQVVLVTSKRIMISNVQ
jgi:hypothetical protein